LFVTNPPAATAGSPTLVSSIFNGNFALGTNQSLLTWLLQPNGEITKRIVKSVTGVAVATSIPNPSGRFPLSYSMPGWSLQGGSGFTVNLPFLQTLGIANITVDVTGLFVFQMNPANIFKMFAESLEQTFSQALVESLTNVANGLQAGSTVPPVQQGLNTTAQTVVSGAQSILNAIQAWVQGLDKQYADNQAIVDLYNAMVSFYNQLPSLTSSPITDPSVAQGTAGVKNFTTAFDNAVSSILEYFIHLCADDGRPTGDHRLG
jgi:hypothetical protein